METQHTYDRTNQMITSHLTDVAHNTEIEETILMHIGLHTWIEQIILCCVTSVTLSCPNSVDPLSHTYKQKCMIKLLWL